MDEVADVILTDVEENEARDSNISRFKLVVKLDYKIHCLDCKFLNINWHLLYVSGFSQC